MRRKDDWKHLKPKGWWPYKKDAGIDKQWKKDRDEFFAKSGHGWWFEYKHDNKLKKNRR
jgi:hypothetical protein